MTIRRYRVCDMCGREVKEASNRGTFNREKWVPREPFDLCEACADKVQKFIHGKETSDGDRD
ncbi:hypothetical protein [Paratractidigestivibacter sp.]|uniref:hypothetical protein n=1 Tax=Paratractidigestivibacter sp. TaxID=2847316 RepID=UPI002AC9AD25|nr:hypothetical protein [Paratractidigestivibacter sp.]